MLFDDYKFAFTGESGGASLPRTWTTSTDITWLCFVLDGPWTSWRVTTSLSSSFTTPSWTEWILRGVWDARRCFTSSHQDQWWLSCACALHYLALQLFHSDVMIIINYTFLFYSLCLFFFSLHPSRLSPRHEYTLNGTSTKPIVLSPVPPRYRYIPNNTSAVSVLLAPVLPFHLHPVSTHGLTASLHLILNLEFGICCANLLSACLIRFLFNLLDNLHPNCTCSCPLT